MISRIRSKNFLPVLFVLPMVFLIALQLFGSLILAHADAGPTLPDALLALFGDIQTHAIAAVVIMHVFEILKTHEVFGILGKIGLQGKALQVTIAVITAAGFVANAYAKGESVVQALIEGLFTSGGAMMIYDAYQNGAGAVATAQAQTVVADALDVVPAKK